MADCHAIFNADQGTLRQRNAPVSADERKRGLRPHHPMCTGQHDQAGRCHHAAPAELMDCILGFLDDIAATKPGHSCTILEGWGQHVGYIGEAETLARRLREEASC
jgi:hypothetical protein